MKCKVISFTVHELAPRKEWVFREGRKQTNIGF